MDSIGGSLLVGDWLNLDRLSAVVENYFEKFSIDRQDGDGRK